MNSSFYFLGVVFVLGYWPSIMLSLCSLTVTDTYKMLSGFICSTYVYARI
jgi:hypothetical protein